MSAGEPGGIRPGAFSDDAWATMIAVLLRWRALAPQAVTPSSSLHPSIFSGVDAPQSKRKSPAKGGGAAPE